MHGARTLALMATVRLILEIEADHEPISGRITGPQHQQREFHGWTALATTIDQAIHTDDRASQRAQEVSSE
jgi:hypothetical protein